MKTNYINTTETLQLFIYDNGSRVSADATPTVTAEDLTGTSVTMATVVAQNHPDGYDYYETYIDPTEVTSKRMITVTWSYTYNGEAFTRVDLVEVVAPYFEADDLWSFAGDLAPAGANAQTIEDVQRAEGIVRGIIDAYCRQEFQNFGKQTRMYLGNGSSELLINDKIYKLYTVQSDNLVLFDRDGAGDVQTEIVTWDDGLPHLIRRKAQTTAPFYDIKADISPGLLQARKIFKSGVPYYVEADFGWKNVPNNVRTAAMILAKDYFEENDVYHQQNITVVRSADYRMEFGAEHHTTTGNVHADQLLTDYVSLEMQIL